MSDDEVYIVDDVLCDQKVRLVEPFSLAQCENSIVVHSLFELSSITNMTNMVSHAESASLVVVCTVLDQCKLKSKLCKQISFA